MMQKDEISRISVQMLDGKDYGTPIIEGKPEELLKMATTVAWVEIYKEPKLRRDFRRIAWKILRDTRPAWINTVAIYTLGVGVIFGTVFLFGNGIVLLGKAVGLW